MDVSVMIDNIKFNYRVATIIKKDNKILLHKNEDDDFYAIPGGRVKAGEDSIYALKREFFEEMGENINISTMIGIIENFFEYDDKKYHELMLIYNAEFDKDSNLYNKEIIKGKEDKSKLNFVWKNIDEIKDIDLRPANLKEIILNRNTDFFNIIDKT